MSSSTIDPPELPRWDGTVLHESVESRSDHDALATDLDVTVA